MRYPFEKKPGYSNDFVNPEDKEKFYELKQLVQSLNEEGVKNWFNKKFLIIFFSVNIRKWN